MFILQHLSDLVRFTHQSMPIMMILSPELRMPEPTVGGILKIFKDSQQVLSPRITSTVMAHNLS